MKIITYNINGIRSGLKKGLATWLKATDADVVCFQEVKADREQVPLAVFEDLGYKHIYWHSAQKKGYSGVAVFSKIEPKAVSIGIGIEDYDNEGRWLMVDFENFSVASVYMPSGSSGSERQLFKYRWLDDFYDFINKLKIQKPNLIIGGDFNICHRDIDIHNPKSNAQTSGFLPEERAWMGKFIDSGFVDAFRYLNPEPHNYTWWSTRGQARAKNLGWRIDYQIASKPLANNIKRCVILKQAQFSDHCPVMIEIDDK